MSLARQMSFLAYENVKPKLPMYQARMLAAFYDRELTANEAARNAVSVHGGNAESYRKVTHLLVRKGSLMCVGERRCRVTGRMARVFRAMLDRRSGHA